ncbi:unnamed protein product [Linum trigynum]
MDVSCFLLVEGSADSDDEPRQQLDHQRFTKPYRLDVLSIDDAESCSCDDDDDGCSTLELDDLQLDRINGGLGCVIKDNHDDDDGYEVAMEQCCYCNWDGGGGEEEEEEERSSNSVNKEESRKVMVMMSREAMDRMEDRLFWETCLAVGYPSLY